MKMAWQYVLAARHDELEYKPNLAIPRLNEILGASNNNYLGASDNKFWQKFVYNSF